MGDEDGSQTQARSRLSRRFSGRYSPEITRQPLAQSHRGGLARSGLQRPGESTRRWRLRPNRL
jgi:hypothetical protein